MLIAFHKPYGVLSQFSGNHSCHATLANFGFPKNVYPIGRLDADSEGLLLLSDEPHFNQRLLNPAQRHQRIYWVQVERVPDENALRQLENGLMIEGRRTLPCRAWMLAAEPALSPRDPPIRVRKTVPACWIALELIEGRNRQVRKMTAAISHPTLRLVRVQIGQFKLDSLRPREWRILAPEERLLVMNGN